MAKTVPLTPIEGIELAPTDVDGIVRVRVLDSLAASELPWDRFVRLQATANQLKAHSQGVRLLDVGGYDGALALFLDGFEIELLDPETTGGTATAIPCPDREYNAVTAVDVLEHITPDERRTALIECARVAAKLLLLNYPCRESTQAQQLMLRLTNNAFVKEHVQWPLPDSAWVVKELETIGFKVNVIPHTSVAIWMGQYIVQNLLPNVAPALNSALIANYAAEPSTVPLYHLVVAERKT